MPTTNLRLASLLDRGAWLQRNNLIIEARSDGGYTSITYEQHLLQAKKIALALAAAGIRRGDRVATCCWNTNRHLQLYHCIPCMGAVLHPLNIRLGRTEQSYIIKHAGDQVVFVDEDLLPSIVHCDVEVLSQLKLVVITNEDSKPVPKKSLGNLIAAGVRIVNLAQFLAPLATPAGTQEARDYQWPEDIDENAAAGICYTSGTTGSPKGVVYSHKSTYIHTLAMPGKDNHNAGGADVLLPVVPYFHANGWGIPFMTLMLGSRIVHNRHMTDPMSILRICIDQGVTHSAAVPTIWQTLRTTLEADVAAFKGKFKVRQVLCGGSAPPNEMMDWYDKEFGVSFVQGWGMTETSPMGTFGRRISHFHHLRMTPQEQFSNITRAGVPAAGLEIKIVDPDDFSKDLPNDGVAQGELLARGPWVTTKYFNTNRGSFVQPGNWLATGMHVKTQCSAG